MQKKDSFDFQVENSQNFFLKYSLGRVVIALRWRNKKNLPSGSNFYALLSGKNRKFFLPRSVDQKTKVGRVPPQCPENSLETGPNLQLIKKNNRELSILYKKHHISTRKPYIQETLKKLFKCYIESKLWVYKINTSYIFNDK